jgi:hypothetical protein
MSVVSIENHIQKEQGVAVSAVFQKIATGKSISQDELTLVANFVDTLDLIIEFGAERLGDLVPLERLSIWFNDQSLAEHNCFDDLDLAQITNRDRLTYAREILGDPSHFIDVEQHLGLQALLVTDGVNQIVIGFAISGYGFSGIENKCIGCGRDQLSLIKKLSTDYLLIDSRLMVSSKQESIADSISDDFILSNWCRY